MTANQDAPGAAITPETLESFRSAFDADPLARVAQNAVTQALISYYIARLELFRDMGILVVTPEGIDHEATQRLLEAE